MKIEEYLINGVTLFVILLSIPAVILIPTIFFEYMFSLDINLETTVLGSWSEVWLHAYAGQPPEVAHHALSLDIAGCLFLLFSTISFLRKKIQGMSNTSINYKITWKYLPMFLLEEPSFFTYRFTIVTFLTICSIITNEIFWPSLNCFDQWFLAFVLLIGDKYIKSRLISFLKARL
ncbi:MAG: hypothetical protein ACFFCD_13495 [Promethearchaeota archaeon]